MGLTRRVACGVVGGVLLSSALKEEVAGMRGRDAFQSFYSKLQQATEYHQRFPDVPVRHQVIETLRCVCRSQRVALFRTARTHHTL